MKKAPGKRVAGIGTAMGAVILFGSVMGCQPGTLPCTKNDEWKAICASDGGGGVSNMGGSSGTGGNAQTGNGGAAGSGTGGMMAGGTGGMMGGGGGVNASTALANCADYPKVGDMDKFFTMRCGDTATCHPTGGVFGDLKSADMWMRLTMKNSITCTGSQLADKADYTKGIIWAKTQDMPKCPDGKSAGVKMPSSDTMKMSQPLTDNEKKCLESYLKVLAGQK